MIVLLIKKAIKTRKQTKKHEELQNEMDRWEDTFQTVHNFFLIPGNYERYESEYVQFHNRLLSGIYPIGTESLDRIDTMILDYQTRRKEVYDIFKRIIPEMIQIERMKKFKQLEI